MNSGMSSEINHKQRPRATWMRSFAGREAGRASDMPPGMKEEKPPGRRGVFRALWSRRKAGYRGTPQGSFGMECLMKSIFPEAIVALPRWGRKKIRTHSANLPGQFRRSGEACAFTGYGVCGMRGIVTYGKK